MSSNIENSSKLEENGVVWRVSNMQWGLMVLIAILIGYMFKDGIANMVEIWSYSDEYGYGFIIPGITAFLIWQKKDVLETIEFQGSWPGVMVLLTGLVAFFLGYFSTISIITQYGLVITISGILLSFMGWRSFKIILVPLLILLFMIPLPNFIFQSLSASLQLISSELGVAVIRLFGISVYLEGNVIDLGVYQLQVVEACSGLRYLFPLVTLSFISVYFFKAALWIRAIVFLSSIPITVLLNSFRIGVIGVLVEYGGPEQAEGFLHDFEGWIVFMFCIGLLIVEMWVLNRIFGDGRPFYQVFGFEYPEPTPKNAVIQKRKLSNSFIASFSIIVVAVTLSSFVGARDEVIPERASFSKFPMSINGWNGTEDIIETKYLDVLHLDDYILANYRDENNQNVSFYIAYYKSQRAGESAHSPRACIPGGGWKINSLETVDVPEIEMAGNPLSVNRLLIKKGDYGQLVYYWFQQRDRIITNEYLVKWYLFWDALMKNRTDGALVRLTTPVSPGEDLQLADKRLIVFAEQVQPLMDQYIPR